MPKNETLHVNTGFVQCKAGGLVVNQMDLSDVLKYLADNWFNIAVTAFTAISGIIAYLTWKDSRRGPEIELITPVSSEKTAYINDVTSPFRHNMFFRFPLIFQIRAHGLAQFWV